MKFIILLHTLYNLALSNTYIFENIGHFYIESNGIKHRFREGINPLFYLEFPKGIRGMKLSYPPLFHIPGKSYRSNRPLRDTYSDGIIDTIEFYKQKRGDVTILACAQTKYNSNISLWLDNQILDISYYNNMSYLNNIEVDVGIHKLVLKNGGIGKRKSWKVSKGDGFINSYQIGLWEHRLIKYETDELHRVKNASRVQYDIKSKRGKGKIDIEFVIHYNDLINSQPRSSHTRFHI